jgi:hypothetical protein
VVVEVMQHRLGDGGLQPGRCHGQVAQVGAQQPDPLVLAVARSWRAARRRAAWSRSTPT